MRTNVRQDVLPRCRTRQPASELLGRLDTFVRLDEEGQIALVRAARAYASAIWWSNEDPNLAWIELVSSIEVAATCRQSLSMDPATLIEVAWPALHEALSGADDETRRAVTALLSRQVKAQQKFVDFIVQLAPPPPSPRPENDALLWDELETYARIIYGLRSAALHEGKPFPQPMMESPRVYEDGAVQEVPWGLSAGGLGGSWMASECPMLLSTFEFIARGALLRWWDELAGVDDSRQQGG